MGAVQALLEIDQHLSVLPKVIQAHKIPRAKRAGAGPIGRPRPRNPADDDGGDAASSAEINDTIDLTDSSAEAADELEAAEQGEPAHKRSRRPDSPAAEMISQLYG